MSLIRLTRIGKSRGCNNPKGHGLGQDARLYEGAKPLPLRNAGRKASSAVQLPRQRRSVATCPCSESTRSAPSSVRGAKHVLGRLATFQFWPFGKFEVEPKEAGISLGRIYSGWPKGTSGDFMERATHPKRPVPAPN